MYIYVPVTIFLIILTAVLFLYVFYGLVAAISAAPYVPTRKKYTQSILQLANIQSSDIVMDLGSGDGRVVCAVAETGAVCVGVEINPVLHVWSRLRAWVGEHANVQCKRENLWKTDLSAVDVLFVYFIPNRMEKLHQKIVREMKPGSRIISHGFVFPSWQYEEKNGKMYLYVL